MLPPPALMALARGMNGIGAAGINWNRFLPLADKVKGENICYLPGTLLNYDLWIEYTSTVKGHWQQKYVLPCLKGRLKYSIPGISKKKYRCLICYAFKTWQGASLK